MTTKEIKGGMYQNGEIIQGSINIDSPTYYDTSISSSTDPFASKTNKYAETDEVMIQAITKGVWALFSAAGTTVTAADNSHYIEAGTARVFHIESSKKYLRIIEAAATGACLVTELK